MLDTVSTRVKHYNGDEIELDGLIYRFDELIAPVLNRDREICYKTVDGWTAKRANDLYCPSGPRKVFTMPSVIHGYPVVRIDSLFEDYEYEDIDVRGMDVSRIYTMSQTFAYTRLKHLDLSTWRTPKLSCANELFYGSTDLTDVDIGNLEFRGIVSAANVFSDTNKSVLKSIIFPRMHIDSKINLGEWINAYTHLDYLDMRNVTISDDLGYSKLSQWIDITAVKVKLIITSDKKLTDKLSSLLMVEPIKVPEDTFNKSIILTKSKLLGESKPTIIELVIK